MRLRVLSLTLLSLVLIGPTWGEVNPYEPIEVIPFVPATNIEFTILATASYDPVAAAFRYDYELVSSPASLQDLKSFRIPTLATVEDVGVPSDGAWSGSHVESVDPIVVMWCAGYLHNLIPPGGRQGGLSILSPGVPSIVTSFTRGDVPPPSGQQIVDPAAPNQGFPHDSVHRPTVGPEPAPPEPLDPVAFVDRVRGLGQQALGLAWITDASVLGQLEAELLDSHDAFQAGDPTSAGAALERALALLESRRGQGLDANAYYLLRPNLEFLIDKAVPRDDFELQVTVLEKHVQPHRGRRVEVDLTGTSPPVTYEFSIYRVAHRDLPGELGERVFHQTVQAPDGYHRFVWDGHHDDGTQAHNGGYELVIKATDRFARQASRTVKVQVNFSKGHPSGWLDLGRSFLASLARWGLAPLSALRLSLFSEQSS